MDKWYVSLHDVKQAVISAKKIICISALSTGLLFFSWKLHKPLSYTAGGTFHTYADTSKSALTKTLQKLGGFQENGLFHDDVRTLLDASPTLALVVDKLHLQGSCSQKKRENWPKRWWKNLVLEMLPLFAKKMGKGIYLCDHELFSQEESFLFFDALTYHDPFYTQLNLDFINENTFVVSDRHKKQLGQGKLNEPFTFGENSFTLKSLAKCDAKPWTVTLIPKSVACTLLKEHIVVKPDKKKNQLLHIRCTHPNKERATHIVNETMKAYQDYLHIVGREKISHQLQYLDARKQESAHEFDKLIQGHQEYLKDHLQERSFFNADAQVKYLSQKQTEYHHLLDTVSQEINALKMEKVTCENVNSQMTLTTAKELLVQAQKEWELGEQQKENLIFCQEKLKQEGIDVSSLVGLLNFPPLKPHFERIEQLEFRLSDKRNWSPKEQERMEADVNTEKAFLVSFITEELEALHNTVTNKKQLVQNLKKEVLSLLVQEHALVEVQLKELTAKMGNQLPHMWLQEQTLEFNKHLQTDLLKTLSQTIEERNLSFHLHALGSYPLAFAEVPLLPNAPRLLLFLLSGMSLGAFISVFIVVLISIKKGASVSVENLSELGLPVVQSLDELYFALKKLKHKTILVTSKKKNHLSKQFLSYLDQKNEKGSWNVMEAPIACSEYERKYLESLAESIVLMVHDERLQQVHQFSEKILYFIPQESHLNRVTPLIERLLHRFRRKNVRTKHG